MPGVCRTACEVRYQGIQTTINPTETPEMTSLCQKLHALCMNDPSFFGLGRGLVPVQSFFVRAFLCGMSMCVCVCEREREREIGV